MLAFEIEEVKSGSTGCHTGARSGLAGGRSISRCVCGLTACSRARSSCLRITETPLCCHWPPSRTASACSNLVKDYLSLYPIFPLIHHHFIITRTPTPPVRKLCIPYPSSTPSQNSRFCFLFTLKNKWL